MTLKRPKRSYYEVPRFPDVPYAEWKARIEKAQRLMAENGMDCLVLWGKEDIRYFFGFMTIGSMLAGQAATLIGAPLTVTASALIMLAYAGLLWTLAPRLRQLQ